MRKILIEKTLLKYDELNEDQKIKVLENLHDINVDSTWYDFIFEDYETRLIKLGFSDIKFKFSGFYSQGDGASFSAKHKRGIIYSNNLYYHHSGTMCCDENEILLEVSKRIAKELYRDLESTYEYLTSREAIEETILANEYEFDAETLKIS